MPRIIAIDYGTKRVGMAVTDPLQIIASPLDTVLSHEVMNYLKKYFELEEVTDAVIGLPYHLDGSDTDATRPTKHFIAAFQKKFKHITVHTMDERFSSKIALQAKIASGSGDIDSMSATILLQDFLSMRDSQPQ
jgi:putative Holliday junction resolvase